MPLKTKVVPVSDPAHPSHPSWLEILMTALRAATVIGPVVVEIVDPADAVLAQKLGQIATIAENQIQPQPLT
jgi:hypothetical protein